jgi:outer membrane protein assembly factor BamB
MNPRSSALFLFLAAMPVWTPSDAPAGGSSDAWTQFRGGAEQQGVAAGTLPSELEPAWTFEVADGTESTAAIAGGRVYVPSLAGKLYALGLDGGELLWTYDADGEEVKSSPLVHEGTVYFGDEYGRFHAVDAETGKGRWKVEVDGAISSSANLGDGCILFGSYDNFIYCVKPADGAVVWKVETQGYVHGTPAVVDGKAISSGCDGFLRLVDVKTGATAAELEVGAYVAASPAVRDAVAYFGTFGNNVVAVSLKDAKILWDYDPPELDFPFYSSAAVTEKLVVIGGRDKMVHALDRATGKPAWTHAAGARVDASPVVAGERVYVADTAGVLAALALADGAALWQYETGSGFTASPAIAAGRLVIGTEDGVVYAFAETRRP